MASGWMRLLAVPVFAGFVTGAAAESALHWHCPMPAGSAAASFRPDRYGAALDRFEGLYEGDVIGVFATGPRILFLVSGPVGSKTTPRRPPDASPAGRSFASRAHRFSRVEAPPRAVAASAPAILCARQGTGRNAVSLRGATAYLAAGATVALVDPADPGVGVELQAPSDGDIALERIIGLASRSGLHAGLTPERSWMDATAALQTAGGRIAFVARSEKASPASEPSRAGEGAPQQTVAQAVPQAADSVRPVDGRSEVRPAASLHPPTIADGAHAARVPADRSVDSKPPAAGPRALPAADAYEVALRTLRARQGQRVRSLSALTRVHPAVDALRR